MWPALARITQESKFEQARACAHAHAACLGALRPAAAFAFATFAVCAYELKAGTYAFNVGFIENPGAAHHLALCNP